MTSSLEEPQNTISVVIPTYGQEPALEGTVEEILSVIPEDRRKGLEILIVHTPKGQSVEELHKLTEKHSPYMRYIVETRRGYGVAYMSGFSAAKGTIIATLDADLTYPAEQIVDLADRLVQKDLDFINTNRLEDYEVGAFHWSHGFGNKFLTLWMNLLYMTGFQDSQSGMWIFKKSSWEELECSGIHWEFSAEIKIEAWLKNLKCAEIPVHYRRRKEGHSTNGVTEGIKIAMYLFAKRFGLGKWFSTILRRPRN